MVRETQREREYSLWRGSMAWNKEATSPPWSCKESSSSDILKPPSTFPSVCAVVFQWLHTTGILRTRRHFDACSLFWLAPGDTAQGQPAGKHTVWRAVICQVPCVLGLIVLHWHNSGSQGVSLTLPSPFYPQELFYHLISDLKIYYI